MTLLDRDCVKMQNKLSLEKINASERLTFYFLMLGNDKK